ncbi:MAG: hypothetical protein E6212_05060 [Actinomyces sp.]|uniref:hypothetical protein n=1 Tax=Pauljensenia sp. UMB3104 TaxID=3046331 RepID=UPI002551143D|nr:hypothetical protein [Pauljensenia sp. UMB3104]MBS6967799.1 hypothetical protein [Actinomyces sp.]MDK7159893.1 hypothetical protein [Pauljensenia sp. UMB3104]MDU5163929.1 hypothetical protein [Actinomyces sp.]
MLRDKALPWCQRHSKLITLSTVVLGVIFLLFYGRCHSTPEEFAINFALPAAYTLLALIPGYFIVETVGKGLLKLKGRVDYGLKNKTILLIGEKEECYNVEEQLYYSQLLNKDNITNQSTDITSDTQEYTYNFEQFTKYDLVILCFSNKFLKKIESDDRTKHILNEEQTNLLRNTLESIGNSDTTKEALESRQDITGLITLCPPGSLDTYEQRDPFQRPFTVVVNQIGRMMTDIFSLLTTLPPRNGE